ncbi:c-type cytochrome biogenesis protein CcmI [Roseicella aerolata]|uniref:C-type cytochrome biogenesis protein CcmI n=1 Tax=Roseicella aerolata TaxID=2883479 RepID=A0A9X1IEK2_9PROT|nr:c-type cytochrome biogenesis protein CcmI [Roseicella aerolata]MCB4823047.1 c-type cytochrome biogenesis protein CcmI [Roseicella aerolata]
MTWLLMGLLAAAALLPLALAALRPPGAVAVRGRREADLALYRAQLAELDRERNAGRLDEAAHRAAVLEVQRRLLAAPEEGATAAEARARGGAARLTLMAAAVAVPVFALGIYRLAGVPDMPSVSFAERREATERDDALLATLRAQLAQLDPASDAARQGWVLLADAERNHGRLDAAAEAYRRALAGGFDADLAGQLTQVLLEADRVEEAEQLLAEALPRAPRHIGLRFLAGLAEARAGRPEAARAAWRALLADAPPDAPWRVMVERRMANLP